MNFGFGINFSDLSSLAGIFKLDKEFLQFLVEQNFDLYQKLNTFRRYPENVVSKDYSELLIEISPILDDFLSELFSIENENLSLKQSHQQFDVVYECRRKFVQRQALKKYSQEDISQIDFAKVSQQLEQLIGKITEQRFATKVMEWQKDSIKYTKELDIAAVYSAYMVHSNSKLTLFDVPRAIMHDNHISDIRIKQLQGQQKTGFDYRDEIVSDKALAHAKYCIYCHKQDKDSCSKGLLNNSRDEETKNGCPLDQKISEMNKVKSLGFNIAALAIITIDNPMVAATGHRICNDCMKACIYQKQDPVNIPLIESDILENVLSLNWGVEIYLLLTKWNPLKLQDFLPKADSGYNILVTGLGPAGFALSHYLLNDGHNVVAIDGLKINPLAFDSQQPIKNWQDIKESLSSKIPSGVGGVAEYGITHRWDKNNLTLIRLILERNKNFRMYGNIRLGSNITSEQAFAMGFDHIALCLGAGEPKFLKDKSFFVKGVRSSSDFLMNLQQGGAYLPDTNSNLLLRLPAIVIGCGLTAIDSAVEVLHYYPLQVKRFLSKYEKMLAKGQKPDWNMEEREIAEEFIAHAKLFRKARNDEEKLKIVNDIGGVTICYRKSIKESPAYRLNHEEIEQAIAVGVKFKENIAPEEVQTDEFDYVKSIRFTGGFEIPARSVLIAIGTENNKFLDIDYSRDNQDSDIFKSRDGKFSYFGDCNPKYAGNVVKALSGSKKGYKAITAMLEQSLPHHQGNFADLIKVVDDEITARIQEVNMLSDDIVELVIHSPLLAKNFQPGQFFKLQNYSNNPKKLIEPLALTGSDVDAQNGTISLIVLAMGKSSHLCFDLKVGERVALMGPTGAPTKIARNKNILLIGGGLGNAVLIPTGRALRKNGCNVTYIAGYKKKQNRFYPEKIESVANQVIWCCDEGILSKNRRQDLTIQGNVIDAINNWYAENTKSIDQIICIGSSSMMAAVSNHSKKSFPNAEIICSLNSSMQCMMKGICGQCIQKVNNSKEYIFACACQDQDARNIDFEVLRNRLQQNLLLEKL